MFLLNLENSVTKLLIITMKGFKPATPCGRDITSSDKLFSIRTFYGSSKHLKDSTSKGNHR